MSFGSHFLRSLRLTLLCRVAAQVTDTNLQTLTKGPAFSALDSCAQNCIEIPANCFGGLDGGIGCAGLCGTADNDCLCRTDHQSAATSYLSSCIGKACTPGDPQIDVTRAVAVYDSYCVGLGYALEATIMTANTAATSLITESSTSFTSNTPTPNTALQTLTKVPAFSALDSCAQNCIEIPANCFGGLDGGMGCAGLCGTADNDCLCRTDHQSAATSYLSSCIGKACTPGDPQIDVTRAVAVYDSYCLGLGYALETTTANIAATTPTTGSSTSSTSGILAPNTTSTPSSTPGGGLSPQAIAGITIGGFVVAIITLWISWEQLQRMRSNK
jgi:hypothetical protein